MLTVCTLKGCQFIILPAALGLLLPALFLPWIAINFLGLDFFSPIDMFASAVWDDGISSAGRFELHDFITTYKDTSNAFVVSMTLYALAVVSMVAAISFRRRRSELGLVAGILAIASSSLWFYSIESLKDNFSRQASITGGIIGEEFKGHERDLADAMIVIGSGSFVALAGGAIAAFSFITEKIAVRKS
jgi:hypothetical protein